MASYYHYNAHTSHAAPVSHNNHGGGRNRRAPRLSVSHNTHRQFRGARSLKDLHESAALSAFRVKFEAGRSFELEDDLEFCPNLLTETDVSHEDLDEPAFIKCTHGSDLFDQLVSISSASERSSLAKQLSRILSHPTTAHCGTQLFPQQLLPGLYPAQLPRSSIKFQDAPAIGHALSQRHPHH